MTPAWLAHLNPKERDAAQWLLNTVAFHKTKLAQYSADLDRVRNRAVQRGRREKAILQVR